MKEVKVAARSDTPGSFLRKSWVWIAQPGVESVFDIKFNADVILFGGEYKIGVDAAEGDYLEFGIVDKDDLLNYGAGTVLKMYVETEYIMPNEEKTINPQSASLVIAGLYFRMRYVSVGQQAVKLRVRYFVEVQNGY